jgi:acylphosphatase
MIGEEQQEHYDCELEERRKAEIDFISCAYSSEEAWCDHVTTAGTTTPAVTNRVLPTAGVPSIHRRLKLPGEDSLALLLSLKCLWDTLNPNILTYRARLKRTSNVIGARSAYKAVPKLLAACREELVMGEESVLRVLSRAEEWIEDNWSDYLARIPNGDTSAIQPYNTSDIGTSTSICFGRRLIYSHHIISKIKRSDIHSLAYHYKLTGYMKVGWPGLILIEGVENDCSAFCDAIRRWSWKFLVVRGEQQFEVREVQSNRKFDNFSETDDMSRVAQHCREVGLGALFRTAMKVYSHDDDDDRNTHDLTYYGALVYVDHMNDTKGYRKWLRKTAKEVDCFLRSEAVLSE